jgi:predicted transcriptional regulator
MHGCPKAIQVAELAELTSADPDALHRLLRYLAHAGVFAAWASGGSG